MFLLAVVCPAVASATPQPWIEAQAAHFTIVSNAGESAVRAVAANLERVYAALAPLRQANSTERAARPTVVIAVEHGSDVKELLPQYWEHSGVHPVAAYWGGPYQNNLVLHLNVLSRARMSVLLHEYVHLLTHDLVPDPPAWLDEGVAGVWQTADVGDAAIEIGHPGLATRRALHGGDSWIPFSELLAVKEPVDTRNRKKVSLFYAESWALAEYLLLDGPQTTPALVPDKYVRALRDTGDPVEAAKVAYGDLSMLEASVRAFVRAGHFPTARVAFAPTAAQSSTVAVRMLSPADALALRAGFLVDGQRQAAAVPLLTEALRLDPTNVAALETLGRLRFQQNRPAEAATAFDRAIATTHATHLSYYYRAILASQAPAVDAAAYLRRAIELNASFAPALERLATVSADAGRRDEAVALLRKATEIEPENAAAWLELAKLLEAGGHADEARAAAQKGRSAAPAGPPRQLLDAFLRQLN